MACNAAFNLGPMPEKEKLTTNVIYYADWIYSLRILLRSAKKKYILDVALLDALPRAFPMRTARSKSPMVP
jgi:hypothetical protein